MSVETDLDYVIKPEDPARPDIKSLIEELDRFQSQLYPAESNHFDDISTLQQDNVLFLCAEAKDRVIGIGAVKVVDYCPEIDSAYGEIKRMFVPDYARGRGVAQALMKKLEYYLCCHQISVARLETGIHQPEATALYRKLGYLERGPFGRYQPDPLSVFMEKTLISQYMSS